VVPGLARDRRRARSNELRDEIRATARRAVAEARERVRELADELGRADDALAAAQRKLDRIAGRMPAKKLEEAVMEAKAGVKKLRRALTTAEEQLELAREQEVDALDTLAMLQEVAQRVQQGRSFVRDHLVAREFDTDWEMLASLGLPTPGEGFD